VVAVDSPISTSEVNAIITKIGNECTVRGVSQTSVQVGQWTCGCDTVCLCEIDGACCETACTCQNECDTVMVESSHFKAISTYTVNINSDNCYFESDGVI